MINRRYRHDQSSHRQATAAYRRGNDMGLLVAVGGVVCLVALLIVVDVAANHLLGGGPSGDVSARGDASTSRNVVAAPDGSPSSVSGAVAGSQSCDSDALTCAIDTCMRPHEPAADVGIYLEPTAGAPGAGSNALTNNDRVRIEDELRNDRTVASYVYWSSGMATQTAAACGIPADASNAFPETFFVLLKHKASFAGFVRRYQSLPGVQQVSGR
jgi:hypothetical protein